MSDTLARPRRFIGPGELEDVPPKTAGDRLEDALVSGLDPLEPVPDEAAEWHDARTRERVTPSPALPTYRLLVVPSDVPVEVKTARVEVSNGASATTAGRFYIKRGSHERLVDAGGVYLLAVYDPDVPSDEDAVRGVVVTTAEAVDDLVETWTDAEVGGADAEVAKVRWSRVLPPSDVLDVEAVTDGGFGRPGTEDVGLDDLDDVASLTETVENCPRCDAETPHTVAVELRSEGDDPVGRDRQPYRLLTCKRCEHTREQRLNNVRADGGPLVDDAELPGSNDTSGAGSTSAVDEDALGRERFGKLLADIGEDPARYLDHELVTGECRELAEARVSTIRDPGTLAAFRAVEQNLGRGAGGGPRSKVLEWLDDAVVDATLAHYHAAAHYLSRPYRDPLLARLALAREWRQRLAPVDDRLDADHPSPRERLDDLMSGRATEPLGSPKIDSGGITEDTPSTLDGLGEPDPEPETAADGGEVDHGE